MIDTRAVTSTRPGPVWVIDGLLSPRYADMLLRHWRNFGGYRFDSTKYTKTVSPFNNGLDKTVRAPGMQDLFSSDISNAVSSRL